jgi:hypothetical protein
MTRVQDQRLSGDIDSIGEDSQEGPDILHAEYEELLNTNSSTGLTDEEVTDRLKQFGPNGT